MRRRILLLMMVLLPLQATGAGRIKRLAILAFENASPDTRLDWVGIGLEQAFHDQLKRIPTITVVEREGLDQLMREIDLSRSRFVRPEDTHLSPKFSIADSVLKGTYKVVGTQVVLSARVVDVETGLDRVAADEEGAFKDILKLQASLARKLIEKIQEAPLLLEIFADRNIDAFHAFSDGLYFLHHDSPGDALTEFNRALAIDSTYVEAQFQRGLALRQLERLDDAIAAFRRALPRSAVERRVVWNWQTRFAEDSQHGTITGADPITGAQKKVIFGERKEKSTQLFLLDLEKHRVVPLEVPNTNIEFENAALRNSTLANDRFTLIFSADTANAQLTVSGISNVTNSLIKQIRIPLLNGALPIVRLVPNGFLVAESSGQLTVFDGETFRQVWSRDGLLLDKLSPPIFTGGLMIVRTASAYRAVGLSDGMDVWTVPLNTPSASAAASDRLLLVFDHNERLFAVDLVSGRTLFDLAISQAIIALNTPYFGTRLAVHAVLEGNRLFLVTKTGELAAVNLDPDAPASARVLWRTPLNRKVASLRAGNGYMYVGTDSGELITIDAASGKVGNSTPLAPRAVYLDYAAKDLVVATSDIGIFALEPDGRKRWEYPSTVAGSHATFFKGVIAARTSPTTISTIDARTGQLLWHHVGQPNDLLHLTSSGFFVVEENGIKEYAIDIRPSLDRRPSDKEVLTEMAGAMMAKGDRISANSTIEKARALDPDYPPLRWLLAEFAIYADLVGRDTPQGQRAIEELKRRSGLEWAATVDGSVAGAPAVVGGRIVNVGGPFPAGFQIAGLDPSNGRTAWRQPSERLIDSVTDNNGHLWYVSGQAANPSGLTLYRMDAESGERQELVHWNRPLPVNAAYLSYARNRLFVAALTVDFQRNRVYLGVDCFDAGSGSRLWASSRDVTVPTVDIQFSFSLYAPQGDNLVYSLGHEIYVINAADGGIVDQRHEDHLIAPDQHHNALPDGLVYYVPDVLEVLAYDIARKDVTRFARPEMETPFYLVRDGVFLSFDKTAVFGVDLSTGKQWRVRGKFRTLNEDAGTVWALRNDNIVLKLDRATGKILSQFSTLWRPHSFSVIGSRFYAFTSDGLAYCINLKQ